MGLIKKFADYAGVKHSIDPTGHSHTTSESWLSTIVNNLTTLINGKAASVHTHASITDGAASVTAMNDRGSHIIRINATGVDGSAVDADHAVEDSDNLITSGAVYSDLAGKAASVHTHTQIYNSDSLYVDVQESQGAHDFSKVRLEASAVSGTAVTSDLSSVPAAGQYPSAARNKIVTSGAIKDALDEKADSSDIPTKTSDLTNDSGFLTSHQNITGKEDKSNKVLSTTGDLNANSTDTQYPSAKLVFERACGTTAITIENLTTLDIVSLKEGQSYLLDQSDLSTNRELQDIIPETPDGDRRLCGNGTLAKDYMLIRIFHYSSQYIVEVLASFDQNEF